MITDYTYLSSYFLSNIFTNHLFLYLAFNLFWRGVFNLSWKKSTLYIKFLTRNKIFVYWQCGSRLLTTTTTTHKILFVPALSFKEMSIKSSLSLWKEPLRFLTRSAKYSLTSLITLLALAMFWLNILHFLKGESFFSVGFSHIMKKYIKLYSKIGKNAAGPLYNSCPALLKFESKFIISLRAWSSYWNLCPAMTCHSTLTAGLAKKASTLSNLPQGNKL